MQMPLTVRGLSGAGLHLGPQGNSLGLYLGPGDVLREDGCCEKSRKRRSDFSWGRKGGGALGGGVSQ